MYSLLLSIALALPPIIPVSEIKPGDTGECLTVFQGNRVEPFPFTVRGVMHNFLGPGQDVVLVRLGGDKAEFTGVAAGMSGSPCSIGGRLVGALAYAFATFAKEPIAGITPISRMLDVMRLPDEPRPWRIGQATKSVDWQALREGRGSTVVAQADTNGLVPIATALSLGGFAPSVTKHFSPWLEANGFEPMAVGSQGSGAKPRKLEPGAAVAAVLIRGDVDVAATGTVTAIDGDQVVAFGHPFFGAGAVSLPMANAEIVNTMVSTMRSFKMATPGAVIGEVTQDRLTAVGGYLGRAATMSKVSGSIKTLHGVSQFQFEVARDQSLAPRLVSMGIANSLTGRVDVGDRGTVRLEARISAAGQAPVVVRNVYAADRRSGLLVSPSVDVGEAFDLLWDTPFGPPPKMTVEVTAEVNPEPIIEWIEALRVDRPQAKPGDKINAAVHVRRRGGGSGWEHFVIVVPHAWTEDDIEIIAAGSSDAERVIQRLDGQVEPESLADIVKWLSQRRPDGQVYLLVTRKGTGVRTRVDVLPFLPPSFVATMSGVSTVERRSRGLAWEERRARPGTVMGVANATVRIVKP